MPSPLSLLFQVLIVQLEWEARQDQGTKKETWQALLGTVSKFAQIKNNKPSKVVRITEKHSFTIGTPISVKSQFESLPNELLTMILDYITDQKSLYTLSLLNRRWSKLMKSKLYISPYLTSPRSIHGFLQSVQNNSYTCVSRISFGPTTTGCLSSIEETKNHFEFIPYVHSGLFRFLIHERDTSIFQEQLVHPIFYEFAKALPNCIVFEEFGYHKERAGGDLFRPPIKVEFRNFEISKIPSSSINLVFLFRACQRWFLEYPEWKGLKDSVAECMDICILLLEWFQGDYHPIWHSIGSDIVRQVKPLISSLARNFLSHVYSSLLLQVRFVTSNSQRLLDSYCLIYYQVLSLAQNLDVYGLADAMGCPIARRSSTEENAMSTSRILMLQQVDTMSESQASLSEVLLTELQESYTPTSIRSSVESIGLSVNQEAARFIYEALVLIFHFRIPANLHSSKTYPPVPVELLRDILITFPPSSINSETIELISRLVTVQLDILDETTSCLQKWLHWLKEIVQWHEASREMDPVKDLLRKSMSKIDQLRSIQRQYGIVFMD